MPEIVVRRSPLHGRVPIASPGNEVALAERPFLGKFVLRASAADAAEPVVSALGLVLPVKPLTAAVAGDTALLWMGPDEWMLVTNPAEAEIKSAALSGLLSGRHAQLVDVSDYYAAIDVAGPAARELLMKLTTLDLHPRAFTPGMVTGSVFGRANATIWDLAETAVPTFRLFVRWSMADYLWCLLAECGREWAVPEQVPFKGERLTTVS